MSSDNKVSVRASESEQSHGSHLSIEKTCGNSSSSETSDELSYYSSVEPIATPEEHAKYQRVISLQVAEQQQQAVRFSSEQTIDSR